MRHGDVPGSLGELGTSPCLLQEHMLKPGRSWEVPRDFPDGVEGGTRFLENKAWEVPERDQDLGNKSLALGLILGKNPSLGISLEWDKCI
jgi:hypothetical protein